MVNIKEGTSLKTLRIHNLSFVVKYVMVTVPYRDHNNCFDILWKLEELGNGLQATNIPFFFFYPSQRKSNFTPYLFIFFDKSYKKLNEWKYKGGEQIDKALLKTKLRKNGFH